MTTTNNAAALERIEHYACTLRLHSDVGVAGAMAHKISDELLDIIEELRTLAQPDALTSQPSGEIDIEALRSMWRALIDAGGATTVARHGVERGGVEWAHTVTNGMLAIERHLHPERFDDFPTGKATHPSADAPGVAVDEAMATRAIFARNEYLNRHPGEALGAMHAALTAALAPKPEGGHAD